MLKMDIKTTHPWDGTVIVRLSGKFNIEQVVPFETAMNGGMGEGIRNLGIDMSHVDYVDSSAIGCLIKYANITKGRSIDLYLIDLKPDIRHIFKTAYLDKFFMFINYGDLKRKVLNA